jgi:hypothetical protein
MYEAKLAAKYFEWRRNYIFELKFLNLTLSCIPYRYIDMSNVIVLRICSHFCAKRIFCIFLAINVLFYYMIYSCRIYKYYIYLLYVL